MLWLKLAIGVTALLVTSFLVNVFTGIHFFELFFAQRRDCCWHTRYVKKHHLKQREIVMHSRVKHGNLETQTAPTYSVLVLNPVILCMHSACSDIRLADLNLRDVGELAYLVN